MKRGVTGRQKPSSQAQEQHRADVAFAARRADLLDVAREAESQFRKAQARRAPVQEIRRLADDLDAALTEAMRAAYAAQRVAIGALGYDDRIYRRKAMAKPAVHALTAQAEHLLTLRETHRLNDIPAVPFEVSTATSPAPHA
jgi:hypothetical protein